jgi:metal-responsive CopG/Arc/MetJ family transcriptional regulator
MTENKMVSTRIDITLDTKILKELDALVAEYGSSSNRSAMIAGLIHEKHSKEKHNEKVR